MGELLIYEGTDGNENFARVVHTLFSFGVDIHCLPYEHAVSSFCKEDLPVSLLNGVLVKMNDYPTKQELLTWLQFPVEFFEDESTGCSLNGDGCCGCGCCYE